MCATLVLNVSGTVVAGAEVLGFSDGASATAGVLSGGGVGLVPNPSRVRMTADEPAVVRLHTARPHTAVAQAPLSRGPGP